MQTWHAAVHHDGSANYVGLAHGQTLPHLGDLITIRLRTALQSPIRNAYLRIQPDGEQTFLVMKRGASDSVSQWWETQMHINEPRVQYRFLLQTDEGIWYYSGAGMTRHDPLDSTDFYLLADWEGVKWARQSVFYQIYPDSFARGILDKQLEPAEYRNRKRYLFQWEETPPQGISQSQVFFGGDLVGITQHMDYLQELGVNAIYLNPIFTAYTSHRYDVIDYDNVDPVLGGNAALRQMAAVLHDADMHYILDVVPNHCGVGHTWFLKAQADINAPETEFFTFIEHPHEYLMWLQASILVKLNYTSTELRRRIYEGDESLMRKWLRPPYHADGWRVDVGNMLGRQGAIQINAEIIRGLRQAVKTTKPDAYFMGENFFDTTAQLQGDQWDGGMNYKGFSLPLLHWLRGYHQGAWGFHETITSPLPYTTEALVGQWQAHLGAIPYQVALHQYNLLDSHDTSRLRSELHGNDALHRLAIILLMTFPGIPSLYYGDEIGMENDAVMRSRGCMVWDKRRWNQDLLSFHKALVALRRQSLVLQEGGFQILAAEADTVAYVREWGRGRIIVVAHRSETARPEQGLPVAHAGIPDGTRFMEFFDKRTLTVSGGMLPLRAHPQGATLWIERS